MHSFPTVFNHGCSCKGTVMMAWKIYLDKVSYQGSRMESHQGEARIIDSDDSGYVTWLLFGWDSLELHIRKWDISLCKLYIN